MSALSTKYVQIPITATTPTGAPYNPTADPVWLAFMITGWPGDGDWQGGTWASVTSTNNVYWAQLLVGPGTGGLNLGPGGWAIWYKITDDPEVPVDEADFLRIV